MNRHVKRFLCHCVCCWSNRSFIVLSGTERDSIKVCLRAAELISCEWCSVRKLPVLFFQTTPEESGRLRTQLNMSEEKGGQWYDCTGDRKLEYTQSESKPKGLRLLPAVVSKLVPLDQTVCESKSACVSSSALCQSRTRNILF